MSPQIRKSWVGKGAFAPSLFELWRTDRFAHPARPLLWRHSNRHATKDSSANGNMEARGAFHARPNKTLRGRTRKGMIRNDNEEVHLRPRCGNAARSLVTRSTSQCAAGSPYLQRIGFRGRRERTLSLRSAKSLYRTHRRHARLSWTPHRQARSRLPEQVTLKVPSAHQRAASGAVRPYASRTTVFR